MAGTVVLSSGSNLLDLRTALRATPTNVRLPPHSPRCSCLREIRAAVAHDKPLILVHESDPAKGGAPLKELRDMCPADLRDAIFCELNARKVGKGNSGDASEAQPLTARPLVPWHRLVAFQLESLRQIAEAALIHSPKYKGFLAKVYVCAARGQALGSYAPAHIRRLHLALSEQ
jgi:hypothetical protein